MTETSALLESEIGVVRGIIVPVVRYDNSGMQWIYVVEHNNYADGIKRVNAGEMSLLSETFENDGEPWICALERCLYEELGFSRDYIKYVLSLLERVDRFSHSFSPNTPNGNGYSEAVKYHDYLYRPTGQGDVIVMRDNSDLGVLPTGKIGTREVKTADYIPLDDIFDSNMLIRQSYNMRVVLAEMEARYNL